MIRTFDEEGGIVRLVLDAGKGNLLGVESVAALRAALAGAAASPAVRAILIDPAGPAFCHGASVEEHVPPVLEPMLRSLGALVVEMVECPVPIVACVRGPCLGGGLELALGCTRIVASPDARLGQPEVKLGVFAPIASVLLPRRIGEAAAAAMLLTGGALTGSEALAIGLVDELADDPTAGARAFVARMAGLSASAIRFAHRSARGATARALWAELPALEQRYLSDLQETHDAREGIAAFLERRRPAWRNG